MSSRRSIESCYSAPWMEMEIEMMVGEMHRRQLDVGRDGKWIVGLFFAS
jgi:hypothetical protein